MADRLLRDPRMLRIGSVPYLNGWPLIEGLSGVVFHPPSDLARLLGAGKLDVALVSVSEAIRNRWAYVPGIAVASPGTTYSVRLHHAVGIPEIRRVALDRNSSTSNALARIILERRYNLSPKYVMRDPSRGLSFKGIDAAVTIGDTTFHVRGWPFVDLGTEWREWTGRPLVYAVWAYRKGHPRAREMGTVLREAKKRGLARLPEIAREEARSRKLSPGFCLKYLTKYITYDLGSGERAGLRLFARYLRELS
jgi:chorismate dehydratase